MKSLKLILSGIVFGIIAQVVHTICAFAGMGYYTDAQYFSLWSKLMMPSNSAPGLNFYIWSIVFAIIGGLLVALVYSMVKKSLQGEGVVKGLFYGLILILVVAIPSTLSMFLLLNIPVGLLILWFVENVVIYLVGGMVIAVMNK